VPPVPLRCVTQSRLRFPYVSRSGYLAAGFWFCRAVEGSGVKGPLCAGFASSTSARTRACWHSTSTPPPPPPRPGGEGQATQPRRAVEGRPGATASMSRAPERSWEVPAWSRWVVAWPSSSRHDDSTQQVIIRSCSYGTFQQPMYSIIRGVCRSIIKYNLIADANILKLAN
jgi:hypothetical protein